ncbi:carbohydrate ABC transporter permease [Spongiactinospora rosea]|uniref:Carbohydrate ABC transporter permease n=1 Tax=Spongiactinospora rosea TaxID=2248750 RepID=A0A366M3N5_9ACTN|nr:carbohydrate ABC transporter permease [Spongiactinospora rosea]RBQ20657.1 carbohydrate ABC transporter permease [Spongiactinospora rosea]
MSGLAPGRWAAHATLLAGAVIVLVPFYVMLRAAFAPPHEVQGLGLGFTPTLENFRVAWSGADWPRYYLNSVLVTGLILLLQVATALPAGYALARLRLRGGGAVRALVLCCLVVPGQITAIPVYVGLSRAGLGDTLVGLVIPFGASAFGVYLFRQFILSIPQNVFDAARMDGVGPVGMVWRVVLPNVRPAILAFGVFSVTHHWNDLFWPSVILRTDVYATVPFGVARFAANESGAEYGPQMAAAAMAVTPLMIVFLCCQRQFLRGLALTTSLD